MVAVILVWLVCGSSFLAAAPGLHELFHSDAEEEGHECAATLFANGQVESLGTEPFNARVYLFVIEPQSLMEFQVLSVPEFLLPPSCGPPAHLC